MVKKKLNLVCFDLVCRPLIQTREPPRIVNDIQIIGKKTDAYNPDIQRQYLKDGEVGFPINIRTERYQFSMSEQKFIENAETKTKIEKRKEE